MMKIQLIQKFGWMQYQIKDLYDWINGAETRIVFAKLFCKIEIINRDDVFRIFPNRGSLVKAFNDMGIEYNNQDFGNFYETFDYEFKQKRM